VKDFLPYSSSERCGTCWSLGDENRTIYAAKLQPKNNFGIFAVFILIFQSQKCDTAI